MILLFLKYGVRCGTILVFMSSRGFMSLRVVSCLFVWFHVSLHGFMSSCRFDIFVLLSDLRVALVSNGQRRLRGLISSCCFQIFALFSDLRVALMLSNGQRRFPCNFHSLPLHLVSDEPNLSDRGAIPANIQLFFIL